MKKIRATLGQFRGLFADPTFDWSKCADPQVKHRVEGYLKDYADSPDAKIVEIISLEDPPELEYKA